MNKTVKELREEAKELKIKGYYKMKKIELIEAIEKIKQDEKIDFKPENTAIANGNSYSASILASEVNDNEKILDYGLGLGRNVVYLLNQLVYRENISIDGTDIKDQLIKEKNNHNELKKYGCVIDESHLLEKNSYDKDLNSHVLNVVESDEVKNFIVKDIYEKLKDNGKAYFEVRTKSDVESAKSKEKYGEGYKIRKGKSFTYQEAITKDKMEKILTNNGFNIVQHICNSSRHFVIASK